MTMQLLEGFDHTSSPALLAPKGWTFANIAQSTIVGRISGNALRVQPSSNTNNNFTGVKTLPSALTGFVVGFAYRNSGVPTIGGGRGDCEIMRMRSGTTDVAAVSLTTLNHVSVVNAAGTAVATGPTALAINVWYYIELKIFVNGASGTYELQLNGVTEIGSATGNFGSAGADNVCLAVGALSFSNSNQANDWDDIYVVDTSASPNNTFLGDMHVYTLYPSADGTYSQWTPDTGVVHFSRVNEHSGTYPDDDVSYVADSTSGDRDSYAYDDLVPLTGSVFGVQTNLWARKDDAGLRQLKATVRRSGTDYDGATATLGTNYLDFTEIRETDPSTSAAWSISGVNAAEFGVKVV